MRLAILFIGWLLGLFWLDIYDIGKLHLRRAVARLWWRAGGWNIWGGEQ